MTDVPPSDGDLTTEIARCIEQRRFAAALRLLVSAPSGAADDPRSATLLAQLARAAESAGVLDVAHDALVHALTRVDWADLRLALGTLLLRRNRRAEARAEFDRALSLNPRYRAAAVERALLDAREGRIGDALATLRAIAAETRDAEATALREGLERLGEAAFDDAAPLLRRALHTSDTWLDGVLDEVRDAIARGDRVSALHRLRSASSERPGYADVHAMLGEQEMRAGFHDDAIESLARALEINPSFHAARVELARALEAVGDTPQALAELEAVLRCEPQDRAAQAFHEHLTSRRRGGRRSSDRLSNRA